LANRIMSSMMTADAGFVSIVSVLVCVRALALTVSTAVAVVLSMSGLLVSLIFCLGSREGLRALLDVVGT
jgi:hypothetical protein